MTADPEKDFDNPEGYDRLLDRGISLSGEGRDFFAAGRIAHLLTRLPRAFRPRRVLDFGCGTGETSALLTQAFPGAQVVGADTSADTVRWAAARRAGPVSFTLVANLAGFPPFDLCYLNGVLHHIPPGERLAVVAGIRECVSPSGHIAAFDNNPLNPGARLVMRRIPFDRDARMISAASTRRLLRAAGFVTPEPASFLFFFPRALDRLRFAEPWLSRVPLGAQYCVLGTRA